MRNIVKVEAILAVDSKYGLAKDGVIPWKSATDMKFFRSKTIGNIVVMGSKTLMSLPKMAPLGNRFNIILTNNKVEFKEKYSNYDNIVFYNYEELLDYMNTVETDKTIYVIGGKQIYELLFPFCNKMWVTTINKNYDCDLFLSPDLQEKINNNEFEKKLHYMDDELSVYCFNRVNLELIDDYYFENMDVECLQFPISESFVKMSTNLIILFEVMSLVFIVCVAYFISH
jgi:dihydrofolate reductase